MATVKRIIEQARDFSPQFNPQNIQDRAAADAVARLRRDLATMVLQENPSALARLWTQVGLPENWEEGIELPPFDQVLDVDATYEGSVPQRTMVALLSAAQHLTQPHMYPSAYLMGGKLYLTDVRHWWGTAHGWERLTTLRVRYVPSLEGGLALTDDLDLPGGAESALVPALALWMADRMGENLRGLRETARDAGMAWSSRLINLPANSTWMVEVVE